MDKADAEKAAAEKAVADKAAADQAALDKAEAEKAAAEKAATEKAAADASAAEEAADAADRDAVKSPAGQAWLREQLRLAEHEEKFGPRGTGWRYNETLLADIVERAAFLRVLVRLLGELEG